MAKKQRDEQPILNKTEVKKLGFSDAMIRDLLPRPEEKPNPMYSRGAPMKIWKESDVIAVMGTNEYALRFEEFQKRSKKAKGIAEKQREALIAHALRSAKRVQIRKMSIGDLERVALDHKKKRDEERDPYDCYYDDRDIADASEENKKRWMVNYLRHCCTDYDAKIERFMGEVGHEQAYCAYRNAVLDKIATAYPHLSAECERQKRTPLTSEEHKSLRFGG